jgi:D-alanine-D-alanine ligase
MTDKQFKEMRIAVLMGGLSAEREISLRTGSGMVAELKKHGHNVIPVDIDRHSIDKILAAKPDVALIGLHGTYGEDGVIQGILEFLKIPYTGSGVMASAIAMNKVKTKEILKTNGILTPAWHSVSSTTELKKIKLKFPAVFKPLDNGSSVGVYMVKNEKEAHSAFASIMKVSDAVLIEDYIKGTEISVPVLNKKALPIIEIIPQNSWYDYDSKYTAGKSTHIIPARLPKKIYRKAEETALAVDRALDCRDYVRIDMMIKGEKIYVIEANTLPGMTSMSLLPESAKAVGIDFYTLLITLIKAAIGRRDVRP